jgi:hypothetical protein
MLSVEVNKSLVVLVYLSPCLVLLVIDTPIYTLDIKLRYNCELSNSLTTAFPMEI